MTVKDKEPKAEEKQEEVVKAEETPKWAIELKASFDKMADAFLKNAESKQEEDEEKPKEEPKEEEKQEEEPKEDEEPKEEEKQEEEEEEKPEEEEKVSKADVAKMVEDGIKKALSIAPEKKSKVPSDVEDVLTYEKISKMSYPEINALARKMGAK